MDLLYAMLNFVINKTSLFGSFMFCVHYPQKTRQKLKGERSYFQVGETQESLH